MTHGLKWYFLTPFSCYYFSPKCQYQMFKKKIISTTQIFLKSGKDVEFFFPPKYCWWLFRNTCFLNACIWALQKFIPEQVHPGLKGCCVRARESRITTHIISGQHWVLSHPHLHAQRDGPRCSGVESVVRAGPALAVPVRSVSAVTAPGYLRGLCSPWNVLTLQRQLCLWVVILPWHFEVFQLCSLTVSSGGAAEELLSAQLCSSMNRFGSWVLVIPAGLTATDWLLTDPTPTCALGLHCPNPARQRGAGQNHRLWCDIGQIP